MRKILIKESESHSLSFINRFFDNMKLFKTFSLLLFFSLVAHSALAESVVKANGQLQVKGSQLCNEAGDPIALHGVSFGWHNLWPRFYNKKAVSWLAKDW